jgi:hypothetical protein
MTKLLNSMGFTDNPFANYVAENEPDIESYFIRPPYYDAVTERGNASRSLILFGARGAGKSATRLTFYKNAWADRNAGRDVPLVITLDDFSRIVSGGPEKVDLGHFVSEVGYLIVEAVLVWLAALDQEERDLYVGALTGAEEANSVALIQHFYLSRPEILRSATVAAPLKLLNQAWHKRGKLWVGNRWDGIVKLVAAIAQAFTKKAADVDVKLDEGLGELLKAGPKGWNEALYAKNILARFTLLARTFGFSGVTVLVDKADETQYTNNSAVSTAVLLYPLLVNTQLLEVEGFGWLFFLWDLVVKPYSSGSKEIRLDKIAHASIKWEDTYLRELVSQRLRYFSQGKVTHFDQMCDSAVQAEATLGHIIKLSMQSPRELIRVMDTVVREHDEEFAGAPAHVLLLPETIDRALDKYTIETVKRVFEKGHLQQLRRLARPYFINKDVQAVFRINVDTARNRITSWTDAGLVAQTGTRAAEGSSGGKPAYEYTIMDQRLKRMIERDLSLGADYDFVEDATTDMFSGTDAGPLAESVE